MVSESSLLRFGSHHVVAGTFTDDVGFGGEHEDMIKALRLMPNEVAAIQNATMQTYARLVDALVQATLASVSCTS